MKKQLSGSYTVEAAFVMTLLLWSVLFAVQAAYRVRDETAGAFGVAAAAEEYCYSEDRDISKAEEKGMGVAGHPFSWNTCRIKVRESGTDFAGLLGRRVTARGMGGPWSIEITRDVFDPEDFLRKLSLLEAEDRR